MNVKQAYNIWADQYDTNSNKTRDLEAVSLRETLENISFDTCLEIGCGTGKNTQWLLTKAKHITAVDFSEEMLSKAKEKINSDSVEFVKADITEPWTFTKETHYSLVTFSLVLEHIENIELIFQKVSQVIIKDGFLYVGELHPFKQYTGSKARFDIEGTRQIVTCFNHHVTDFTSTAKKYGFEILTIDEHFDNNDRTTIPRILTLLFKKK